MAKVDGARLYLAASGQFAKCIVFGKNGRDRKYVVPADPQTTAQMLIRNKLGDIQRSLKLLGLVLRGELRAGLGPQWNSMIVGELTKNSGAALTAYQAEFDAFTTQQKTD